MELKLIMKIFIILWFSLQGDLDENKTLRISFLSMKK